MASDYETPCNFFVIMIFLDYAKEPLQKANEIQQAA
jgi:hypothetical protein